MNILITSAGRRVSLIRAFQKELKQLIPGGKVFAADANPVLASACHVADGYFNVPFLNDVKYIEALENKCRDMDIGLIIPAIDTELSILAKNKERFAASGIQTVVASLGFIEKCRNKREIHKFFKSHGIAVAKEYTKQDFPLPIFIKPYDGSRSVDTYIITQMEQLREHHFTNEKLMFLEYLDHNLYDEYTCDLYYGKDHLLKCVVPRKRLEVRDGEVNKGLTVRNEIIPYLKMRLARVDGAVGCLTTQFFKHKTEDKIYGIEINPRFGGGFPLTYLAGANYPKWIIEEFLLGKTITEQFDCWEENLLMLRYDDEILVHGYQG